MKAGSLDRQQVEPLVGGRGILDALLAMDLDALYSKLTGPAPAGAARSQNSPWYQILTNGETAPLPPLDPAAPLDFGDIATGDTHTRALRVTSLADGMVETVRSGWCDNRNAYNAKILANGTLVLPKVVYAIFSMGWFDGPVFSSSTVTIPYFQQHYLFVREQPFLVAWTKF